jgi:hypothetical protein
LGNNITSGASFSVRGGAFKYGVNFVDESYSSTTFDSNGFAQLQVVESQTPGVYYNFSISYPSNSSVKQINFKPVMVPNQGAVNLCSIGSFT